MFTFRLQLDVFLLACFSSPLSSLVRRACVRDELREKHVEVQVFAGLGAFVRDNAVPACWGGLPPYALWGPRAGVLFPPAENELFGIIGKNSIAVSWGLARRPGEMAGALKSWSSIFASMLSRRSVLSPQKMRGGVVREDCDASVMRYDRNVSVRT
jgi:hypothetical protein